MERQLSEVPPGIAYTVCLAVGWFIAFVIWK